MFQIDLTKSFTKNSSGYSIIQMEKNKEWTTQNQQLDQTNKIDPNISKIQYARNGENA